MSEYLFAFLLVRCHHHHHHHHHYVTVESLIRLGCRDNNENENENEDKDEDEDEAERLKEVTSKILYNSLNGLEICYANFVDLPIFSPSPGWFYNFGR
ncbi:hypothetical protein M0804_009506 [Polistes exclamans]|nr:hypothetical protein M0804_009506 [Polistes exclamans]